MLLWGAVVDVEGYTYGSGDGLNDPSIANMRDESYIVRMVAIS